MSTLTTGVPDLLRRFVPAPYTLNAVIGGVPIALETNDLCISREMAKLCADAPTASNATMRVKVIRDDQAPNTGSEITVLSSWPLVTLIVGTGTILALDGERREILGFIAPQISPERFALELVPLMLRYYKQAVL